LLTPTPSAARAEGSPLLGAPARLLRRFAIAAALLVALVVAVPAQAGVPITLYRSFAGNLDFVGTAGTLRIGTCGVSPSGSGSLTGIPGSASIEAAYLYWAGSGSTVDTTVTLASPAQAGVSVSADRTFTETFVFNGVDYDFFSGFADVTSIVTTGGTGTYTLSNLAFNSGTPHSNVSGCVGGWSLVVIFEDASEPFRVVNVFDGFQSFRGASVSLTPDNFVVPTSPINGKLGHISWEGDVGNSASLGGFQEQLQFEGTVLTDASNPSNNQFNSISNVEGTAITLEGVDFDVYPLAPPLLSAGQTSGTTVYSSGGDLVLLSAEVFSVTNTPVADLSIDKTSPAAFDVGTVETWSLDVANSGPIDEPGPIVVTDALPAGVSFDSAAGSGWACSESAGTVTCTHPGPLAVGSSLPTIGLSVLVDASAMPSVDNTATVAGSLFDNVSANNSDLLTTPVVSVPNLLVFKTVTVLDDPANGTTNPKAIPGANVIYTIGVSNQGSGAVDTDTLLIEDALPSELELFVDAFGNRGLLEFTDGATGSGIDVVFTNLADDFDDVEFDDGTDQWLLDPSADAEGFDASVTAIRIRPSGQFLGSSGSAPSFEIRFRARIR